MKKRLRSQPLPLPDSLVIHRRGSDRLNALSDGVVAIAITLLVFPITNLATSDPGANVVTIVMSHRGSFFTFFITFVMIAKLWKDSHGLYRDVVAYTQPLMWIHIFWLLAIVFVTFPMDVLASADDAQFPNSALYVGTLLLATATLFVEFAIVQNTSGLKEEGVDLKVGMVDSAADVVAVGAAFLATVIEPQWGLKPLLFLIGGHVVGWIAAVWYQRRAVQAEEIAAT